jgi:hypothetical protein
VLHAFFGDGVEAKERKEHVALYAFAACTVGQDERSVHAVYTCLAHYNHHFFQCWSLRRFAAASMTVFALVADMAHFVTSVFSFVRVLF